MNKFLNKWFRKFHRWMALPTGILIPVIIVIKFSGKPEWQSVLKSIDKVQSPLMLILAITGIYLYLLPYIMKWQRNSRQKKNIKAQNSQKVVRVHSDTRR